MTIKEAVDVRIKFCHVDTPLQVIMELIMQVNDIMEVILISLLYKRLLSQYGVLGKISGLSPKITDKI